MTPLLIMNDSNGARPALEPDGSEQPQTVDGRTLENFYYPLM